LLFIDSLLDNVEVGTRGKQIVYKSRPRKTKVVKKDLENDDDVGPGVA